MNGTPRNQGASAAALWLVHFAFIMTVPVYGVMGTLFLVPKTPPPPGQTTMMLAVLGGLSLVTLVMGLTINLWFRHLGQARDPEPAGRFLARAMVKVIVGDAIFESIAIYGMVGILMGFQLWQAYLFMGVSLLALLIRIAMVRAITDEYQRRRAAETE